MNREQREIVYNFLDMNPEISEKSRLLKYDDYNYFRASLISLYENNMLSHESALQCLKRIEFENLAKEAHREEQRATRKKVNSFISENGSIKEALKKLNDSDYDAFIESITSLSRDDNLDFDTAIQCLCDIQIARYAEDEKIRKRHFRETAIEIYRQICNSNRLSPDNTDICIEWIFSKLLEDPSISHSVLTHDATEYYELLKNRQELIMQTAFSLSDAMPQMVVLSVADGTILSPDAY